MPQDLGSLRRPGRVLARQGAAPLSRLTPTLPVCGARIALRVLKHTCVLRPLHLLRLAVSAAGGARLRSPLQGSLLGGNRLQSLPCKGRCRRRRRRGALPLCGGNILQSLAGPCPMLRRGRCLHRPGNPAIPQTPSGGRERPPYIAAGNGRRRGSGSPPPGLAAGPMRASAPTQGTALHDCHPPAMPAVHGCAARLPCIVGRAISPAGEVCGGVMLRFCASAAPQSSVMPQDRGSLRRAGRVLAGQGAASLSRLTPTLPVCGARIALRVLKHTCVLRPLHLLRLAVSAAGGARLRSSLQGSLLGGSRLQSLPCKGRCRRRRRRGALPLYGGNILQSLAGPCPVFRRGRCLHRPGSPAMPQGLRGGRERPPYIAAGNGRRRGSGSQSQAWRQDDAPIVPEPPRCRKAPRRA